jgi:hypothetical protein
VSACPRDRFAEAPASGGQPCTVLSVAWALTGSLTGPERAAVFRALPEALQARAWDEIAGLARKEWQ